MKTTLLIMAAGIGSRFGKGIKQLEPVDEDGHIIMDYSIHDAIEAGFNHVVFIIRKDIEKEFKEVIGDRIASICSSHNVTVDYAFQDINDIPGELPAGRTKPWGTGQAVLAAKDVIKTPFIVINADDYYGKEGFKAVHEYLVNGGNRTKIEPLAQQKLAESLVQKYGEDVVFVNKVVVNDMNFEDAYNEAIQQKSIAQQNADKQKIENEAAIAKAEADKQVAITNAEAEAQKTSIAADAQAEANRKLAESLSDTLIDYQKIQKWDGKGSTYFT